MDNKLLWTLTARNVVKFNRIATNKPNGEKRKTRKLKVRQAIERKDANIKVVVTR